MNGKLRQIEVQVCFAKTTWWSWNLCPDFIVWHQETYSPDNAKFLWSKLENFWSVSPLCLFRRNSVRNDALSDIEVADDRTSRFALFAVSLICTKHVITLCLQLTSNVHIIKWFVFHSPLIHVHVYQCDSIKIISSEFLHLNLIMWRFELEY